MDELKRLVNLSVKNGSKSSPLINPLDSVSLEAKLYNYVKENATVTDEDAAMLLYGNTGLSTNYRMLKSRMRRKLLNNVYFLKVPESVTEVCQAEINECMELQFQARKLIMLGELKVAAKLVKHSLKVAKGAELVEFIVKALELELNIALYQLDVKQLDLLQEELRHYNDLDYKQKHTSMLFQKAKVEIGNSIDSRESFYPTLLNNLDELKCTWEVTKLSKIFYQYYLLQVTYLELSGQLELIPQFIDEASALVAAGKVSKHWFNVKFNTFVTVYALLRTGRYKDGIAMAKESVNCFVTYSLNWFAFMENFIQLAIYDKQYDLAVQLMGQVMEKGHVFKLNRSRRERWELHRRYLLLVCERLGQDTSKAGLDEEICDLKEITNDKTGYNLPIIILLFLEQLSDGLLDELEAQPERISKYIAKYLKGEKAERVRTFLRMLILVVKEQLDQKKVHAKSQTLLQKLTAAKHAGDAFAELEIVPYEQLWDLVLGHLQQKKLVYVR